MRIANIQFILEKLLNQTPNSTSLQRAYNNSMNLEEKFRSKTARRFVEVDMEDGRKGLKEENDESNDMKERTQIKAEGIENSTKIEKTVENERKKDESQKITETEKRLDR